MAVVQCLHSFAMCSGLHANPGKTQIYMGGVAADVRQLILDATRFSPGALPFSYLGLPLTGNRLKVDQYQTLIDRFARKIHHWSASFLSHAGKLRLIDSVLYSNLVYWCSVFRLPIQIVHKLEACSRNLYWGMADNGGGIPWMQWACFTRPRDEDGAGIKEILSWNKALLLKWVWEIFARPPSLWLNWVEAYCLNGYSIWTVPSKLTDPWVWSEVLKLRDEFLLKSGNIAAACSRLVDWTASGGVKFRVGEAYNFFRTHGSCVRRLRVLWESFAPPKYGIVGRQASYAKLATIDNLHKRGFQFVNRCFLCKGAAESHSHLLFQCSFMQHLWRTMMLWVGVTRRPRNIRHELEWLYSHRKGKGLPLRVERAVFMAIIYHG
ncbi:hypothetical protein RND81_03G183800 [Saponaria officinalis]|uniref:Reverse transcriptase zinc-binding domain-containing protein n=1 Tax=Saponaria officinalis TaxID=3572 RepID=A0AAW1M148_SAPOF